MLGLDDISLTDVHYYMLSCHPAPVLKINQINTLPNKKDFLLSLFYRFPEKCNTPAGDNLVLSKFIFDKELQNFSLTSEKRRSLTLHLETLTVT